MAAQTPLVPASQLPACSSRSLAVPSSRRIVRAQHPESPGQLAALPVCSRRQGNGSAPMTPRRREAHKGNGSAQMTPRTREAHKDVVQWTAPVYVVEENEGSLIVEVMRLGTLMGPCTVQYRTEDASAKAGKRYHADSGQITFESGEHTKPIKLEIIEDEFWASTLEFKIVLSDPEGCRLGLYLHVSRVKILDCDVFPSNRIASLISEDDDEEQEMGSAQGDRAVQDVPSATLLIEFFRLLISSVPGVRWRTLLIIVMDQMWNLYTLLTLFLNQYLVDVLFNIHEMEESSEELFTRQGPEEGRYWTACIVAALYICPMILLHIWDYQKTKLDLGGVCREYLQESLFRRYLNYSEASRSHPDAAPAHMHVAMVQDTAQTVEGFLAALNLIQCIGNFLVLTYFILHENFHAIVPLVIMPLAMVIFVLWRSHLQATLSVISESKTARVIELVTEACQKYRLIADYQQRPQMCDLFIARTKELSVNRLPVELLRCNNRYFPLWLGPLFTGAYLIAQTRMVLSRQISLGTFIATIKVFSELSEQLSESYSEMISINKGVGPLRKLTFLFNRETDLRLWKQVNEKRRELSFKARHEAMGRASVKASPSPYEEVCFRTDSIPIKIENLTFGYRGAERNILENVNVEAEQGMLVAIAGKHGKGKSTLLRLLGHALFPDDGIIFVPTYLRILHVTQDPVMLRLSAWQNLTFGNQAAEPKRVNRILEDISMPNVLRQVYFDLQKLGRADELGDVPRSSVFAGSAAVNVGRPCSYRTASNNSDSEGSDSEVGDPLLDVVDVAWQETLPQTEKAKLHLARALIVNPEVLVLHRPLSYYDQETSARILGVIKAFVRERGIHLRGERGHRHFRTCFFSASSTEQAAHADVAWVVAQGQVTAKPPDLLKMSDFD